MKDRVIETSLLALVLAVAIGSTANAASVTVATWTSNPNTGGGPLVLNGSLGGNPVTLTTVAVPPNAGVGLVENWTATPATNGYVTGQTPTAGNTSIAIAEGASTLETLAFGLALTNPVLLISFADTTVTYNFDGLNVTLLSANHAALAGNILSFPGATDSDADGAAVQINGTFSSLSFTAADAGGRTDTQRFTVATAVAAAVPEPSSLILAIAQKPEERETLEEIWSGACVSRRDCRYVSLPVWRIWTSVRIRAKTTHSRWGWAESLGSWPRSKRLFCADLLSGI